MKIDPISSSTKIDSYKEKITQRVQTGEASSVSDRVELSEDAQSFASVISDLKSGLDVRSTEETNHIEEVANQIKNGTYEIDSTKIAEKILGGSFDIEI